MITIHSFELLIGSVSLCLLDSRCLELDLSLKHLIRDVNRLINIDYSIVLHHLHVSEKISPPGVERDPLFDVLGVEGVLNQLRNAFLFHSFQVVGDLHTQGVSFFLLSHLLFVFVHVQLCSVLLVFFCDSKGFVVSFTNMVDECAAIADQSPLQGVDQWASFFCEAVGAAN